MRIPTPNELCEMSLEELRKLIDSTDASGEAYKVEANLRVAVEIAATKVDLLSQAVKEAGYAAYGQAGRNAYKED